MALWWTAQNLLTSTADYAELGRALTNACAANARDSVTGTTTADCAEVANALAATEMAHPPEASRW